MTSNVSEQPKRKRWVLQCPKCRVVFEVPWERLEFDREGRVIDGPGTATCPNGHTFDFEIGSLRQTEE
jgi:hypothetical protein